VAAGSAHAQKKSFDAVAKGAEEIRNPAALAALFWAHSAGCGALQNDLAKRQCEGVRKARLAQVAAGTYLVDGDALALKVGAYDAKQKGLPITVNSCLACSAALDVDGTKRFVVGSKGAVAAEGLALKPPQAGKGVRKFKSHEKASKWLEHAVPRLRTQFVVRVPAKANVWSKGKFTGYKVNVLGFRVYDPCNGKVVAASPKARSLPPDKRYCSGEPVVEKPKPVADKPVKKPEPVKPTIPATLSSNQIKEALGPAREAARKCFEVYGVPGMAHFRITISAAGKVTGLEQLKRSDFVDTPTGECIAKAIKSVTFPTCRKKETTIDYPFMLR
jgi:hypothetical protein